MIHPSISTERLVLTPYDMSDVDELHRVMSNPEVMRHIGQGALSRAEVHDIVARDVARWNEIEMGWWTIRLSAGRRLIGQICLRPDKDVGEVAVGYALDVGYWRQGLAREALGAVVDYGFREKFLKRIVATVRPENVASCGLLERCGFSREPDLFLRNKTLCLYARVPTPTT
ncbi:MAG: GNAT family N-acetyltransferase [Reyranellaceae bacterium]